MGYFTQKPQTKTIKNKKMNFKSKFSMKIKLLILFSMMLNCYNTYSQGDEYLDAEKLKMIFHFEPEE